MAAEHVHDCDRCNAYTVCEDDDCEIGPMAPCFRCGSEALARLALAAGLPATAEVGQVADKIAALTRVAEAGQAIVDTWDNKPGASKSTPIDALRTALAGLAKEGT